MVNYGQIDANGIIAIKRSAKTKSDISDINRFKIINESNAAWLEL